MVNDIEARRKWYTSSCKKFGLYSDTFCKHNRTLRQETGSLSRELGRLSTEQFSLFSHSAVRHMTLLMLAMFTETSDHFSILVYISRNQGSAYSFKGLHQRRLKENIKGRYSEKMKV